MRKQTVRTIVRVVMVTGFAIGLSTGVTGRALAQSHDVGTTSGILRGSQVRNLEVFKGIPYATPPLGQLRWRSPTPLAHWSGIRDATKFAHACIQTPGLSLANGGDPGSTSEDCLYLNVWTPNRRPAHGLPVLVWIHGGALIFGSGSVALYDGSALARRGAIIVTINYRLGQLGFFSHPALDRDVKNGPVNFGLLDQIAALRWVRDNIAEFGGDPSNVTIFGQSAGAQSVLALFASPLARGLFSKGIAQSPYGIPSHTRGKARATGINVADSLGLKGASATLAELRAIPAKRFETLTAATVSLQPNFIVGDAALPKPILEVFQKGGEARLPLIIGNTSDDASVVETAGFDPAEIMKRTGVARVALRKMYPDAKTDSTLGREVLRDVVFSAFVRRIAEAHAKRAPAWRYYFGYLPTGSRDSATGVGHGEEIPFVMGTVGIGTPSPSTVSAEDRDMSRRIGGYWIAFATDGKPTPAGAMDWPQSTSGRDRTMVFGQPDVVETNFMRTRLRLFSGMLSALGTLAGRK